MLKRNSFLVLVIVLAVFSLVSVLPATAQLQPTPQPPFPNWSGEFAVKSTIPFAWLRAAPSSVAGIVFTVQPGTRVVAATPPNQLGTIWDGVQWWGYVRIPARQVAGFVELNSLQPTGAVVPTAPAAPTVPPGQAAPWQVSAQVRVRAGVPFSWLRAQPASTGQVLSTAPTGRVLTITQAAANDGVQFWWQLRDNQTNTIGWVEQNSLELIGSGVVPTVAPTATVVVPTAVPPTAWQIGDIVRVKAAVPFAWLRDNPNSTGGVLFTARPNQELRILGGPQNDNLNQAWWIVQLPNQTVGGWVEQSSLDFVRRP